MNFLQNYKIILTLENCFRKGITFKSDKIVMSKSVIPKMLKNFHQRNLDMQAV